MRNTFAKKYSSAFFTPSNFCSALMQMGGEKKWELCDGWIMSKHVTKSYA